MLTETSNIKVVLPAWVYTGEKKERDRDRMAHRYIERIPTWYAGYRIVRIENGFAICERTEGRR
ncbi:MULTISPECIES: hypothetical protein [Bacillus cereus group]|uniref:hypothetical protein n=1 Tax=Bacillus cereus group TaxID=86661 RepID=UPI0018CDA816|nr:hypothetical protein [Bacillus thuringiensis]MBG9511744.1 hypothetical protein [Bacillus thuringiensis]MCQ6305479.1 hypothetical protein [Bacillus cereus]